MELASSLPTVPEFLKVVAHEIRWKILALLARSDYCVTELEHFLERPTNLVSYHLRKLREQHLVTERRSSADGRDIYYSLDLETFRSLYVATGEVLHPALGCVETSFTMERSFHKPIRVLFLCTRNSARSQMAEALLRHLSHGQVDASSAGNQPTSVHLFARQVLSALGADTGILRSKHLNEFAGQSFDYIITVCDRVREACPAWPDDPECIHWSIRDPVMVEGTEQERLHAFEQTSLQLAIRIRHLLALIQREHVSQAKHEKQPSGDASKRMLTNDTSDI